MSERIEPIRPHGVRITWAELPEEVRAWVAAQIGGVTEVLPQQGGFSPGVADRVRSQSGRWAFVKAVGEQLNPISPGLIAREIEVLATLPEYAGAPGLQASFDEQVAGVRWVGLLVEDIPGRHPHTPWRHDEVESTLDALGRLVVQPLPSPVELPSLAEDMAGDLSLWSSIVADPPVDLDPWARANLDHLSGLAADAPARLRGEHLVHADIRSDNLLVTADGTVRVVDWPFACRGAAWFDTLTLLLNVRFLGGPDVTAYEGRFTDLGATAGDLDAVLAGLVGYFLHLSRLPPPPGLPTVRGFQRAQGVAALSWLRQRLDA